MAEFPTYEHMAKNVAEKTLDEILYDGKSVREWIKIIIEQQPCEDCVSRKAVHEMLENIPINSNDKWFNWLQKACLRLSDLPGVQPKERTGHWIYDYTTADGHKTYHCSECGCYLKPKHSEPLNSFKWCSLCGAKMKSEVSDGNSN